ncbi:MAG: (d)CMP kinase [Sediminibacterium sp.]|nr:(d)CMP kinase [Sediminibacterium sp.]
MKTVIAIDGYSGSGKGTLARLLSQELHIPHLDSGAIYRMITYFLCPNEKFNPTDIEGVLEKVFEDLDYVLIQNQWVFLSKGKNIEDFIRQPWINNKISAISGLVEVRNVANNLFRRIGNEQDIIMDGRDIGTCVFPKATNKFFIKSNINQRAERRYNQLKAFGYDDITLLEIKQNLQQRDSYDLKRTLCPLKKARNAITINNTNITEQELLDKALQHINKEPFLNIDKI